MTEDSDTTRLSPEMEQLRKRMESLAWLLDNSIRIPFIGYRIGLDALLGLIPGVGDAAGALMSGYIFYSAIKMKAPLSVLGRMGVNIVFELVFGMIPVLGDIFDMTFKANERNMQLVNAWLEQPRKTQKSSKLVLGGLGGGIGIVIIGGIILGIAVLAFVIRWLLRVV